MDAPQLAWHGPNPVVVGEPVPDDEDGRLQVWTFVAGSASTVLPDELEYGSGQSARRQDTSGQSQSGGTVRDFSRVATTGSAETSGTFPGNYDPQGDRIQQTAPTGPAAPSPTDPGNEHGVPAPQQPQG